MNLKDLIKPASEHRSGVGTLTTVYGDAGIGKTVFSCVCWPKPLLIPIEPGTMSVPGVQSVPVPEKSGNVLWYLQQVEEALDDEFSDLDFRTIILDSVSELDTMISREICIEADVTNIADYGGGFGKGQAAIANKQREIKEACSRLVGKGMNIVAISHCEGKEVKLPDQEPYSRWHLQLVKGSAAQWLNQVDCVVHLKNAITLLEKKGSNHTRAQAIKNQRTVDMVAKPSSVSKNRFGVDKELTFTYNPETGEYNNPIASIYGFSQQ